MPLSVQEIVQLKEECNAIHTKISALLKLPTDAPNWTSSSSLTVKDSVSYIRGKEEVADIHSKEELPEYGFTLLHALLQ